MTQPDLFKYPEVPGFKAQETSKAAAQSMEPICTQIQKDCLFTLMFCPQTADEIAGQLNMSILAIRPRISELLRKGKIEDSGERRPNSSGKNAIVWRIKP